jgi:hypothetical protein
MTDKNKSAKQKTSKQQLFIGLVATAMGLFIIFTSIDAVPTDPNSIHAPQWVLTLAGVMFTFAGLYTFSTSLLLPREQETPIIQWIQYFLILGALAAFATIFLWIGFGSGRREFIERIMFGGGGILSALVAGYYAFTGARRIMSGTIDHDAPWD